MLVYLYSIIVLCVCNPSATIIYMRDKDFDKCRNTSQYSTQYVVKYRANSQRYLTRKYIKLPGFNLLEPELLF